MDEARRLGRAGDRHPQGYSVRPETATSTPLCTDIGPAATQYPDLSFLIYHSGFVPGQSEGPL